MTPQNQRWIPLPVEGPARPNTQGTVQDTRENDTSHPQSISMTDLTATSNNEAVNGNVAVCDDVAVPDITTTAGPNHPRANLNKKTNGKAG